MAEDRGNSHGHIVGMPPDDGDVDIRHGSLIIASYWLLDLAVTCYVDSGTRRV